MMDFIRTWLVGVVVTGIIVSVAHTLTPEGTVRKVVRIAGGFLILLAVLRPLFDAGGNRLRLNMDSYQMQWEKESENVKMAQESVMKQLIEEQTAAYIVSEASTRGLSLEAEV